MILSKRKKKRGEVTARFKEKEGKENGRRCIRGSTVSSGKKGEFLPVKGEKKRERKVVGKKRGEADVPGQKKRRLRRTREKGKAKRKKSVTKHRKTPRSERGEGGLPCSDQRTREKKTLCHLGRGKKKKKKKTQLIPPIKREVA